MINLNRDTVFLDTFPFGKTQNIECRLGRKAYLLDVEKNNVSAFITFYRKLNSDRKSYSKYEAVSDAHFVKVKTDAMLDRCFFQNITEIEKAQRIYSEYGRLMK